MFSSSPTGSETYILLFSMINRVTFSRFKLNHTVCPILFQLPTYNHYPSVGISFFFPYFCFPREISSIVRESGAVCLIISLRFRFVSFLFFFFFTHDHLRISNPPPLSLLLLLFGRTCVIYSILYIV